MSETPNIDIRKVTVAEIAFDAGFDGMLVEYSLEAKNKDLPPHKPNMAAYEQMERMGILHAFAAYSDGVMVGFVTLLITVMPHYDTRLATTESFFVADGHRKGGTAKKLLDAAEAYAKLDGVSSFFVSAPVGGRLAQALPMMGYRETNRVFFRSL